MSLNYHTVVQDTLRLGRLSPDDETELSQQHVIEVNDIVSGLTQILQSNVPEAQSKFGVMQTYIHLRSEQGLFNILNADKVPLEDIFPHLKKILRLLANLDQKTNSLITENKLPPDKKLSDILQVVCGKVLVPPTNQFIKPEELSAQKLFELYQALLQSQDSALKIQYEIDRIVNSLYNVKPSPDPEVEISLGVVNDILLTKESRFFHNKHYIQSGVTSFNPRNLSDNDLNLVARYFVESLISLMNIIGKLNIYLATVKLNLTSKVLLRNAQNNFDSLYGTDIDPQLQDRFDSIAIGEASTISYHDDYEKEKQSVKDTIANYHDSVGDLEKFHKTKNIIKSKLIEKHILDTDSVYMTVLISLASTYKIVKIPKQYYPNDTNEDDTNDLRFTLLTTVLQELLKATSNFHSTELPQNTFGDKVSAKEKIKNLKQELASCKIEGIEYSRRSAEGKCESDIPSLEEMNLQLLEQHFDQLDEIKEKFLNGKCDPSLSQKFKSIASTVDTIVNQCYIRQNTVGAKACNPINTYISKWLGEKQHDVAAISKQMDIKEAADRSHEKAHNAVASHNLPKLRLPYFKGRKDKFIQWCRDWSQGFPPSISDDVKFSYLKTHLGQEPLSLIDGASNYPQAWAILLESYGSVDDEIARLLQKLDSLKRPGTDNHIYLNNLIQIQAIRRNLQLYNAEHKLDRCRLQTAMSNSFTKRSSTELFRQIIRLETQMRITFQKTHPDMSNAEIALLKQEDHQELNLSPEEFSTLFWSHVELESKVDLASSNAKSPYGYLLHKDNKSYDDAPSGSRRRDGGEYRRDGGDRRRDGGDRRRDGGYRRRDDRDQRSTQYNAAQVPPSGDRRDDRKCGFPECKDDPAHFTNQCPRFIKISGELDPSILSRLRRNGICIRCLRVAHHNHPKVCTYEGFYFYDKATGKRKFIRTDCDVCSSKDENGLKINTKVCYCRQKKQKGAKPDKKLDKGDGNKDDKKRNDDKKKKNSKFMQVTDGKDSDECEATDNDDESDSSTYGAMMVNGLDTFGRKSQIIEEVKFNNISNKDMYSTYSLYDSGTSSSFLEEKVGLDAGLPSKKISHTVSTLHGKTKCKRAFLMTFPTTIGTKQLWVLGVRKLSQRYDPSKAKIPIALIERNGLKKDEISRGPAHVELVFGSDASEIWPQELDREKGVILYKSIITGHKLLQGGVNKILKPPRGVMISAMNRILVDASPYCEPDVRVNDELKRIDPLRCEDMKSQSVKSGAKGDSTNKSNKVDNENEELKDVNDSKLAKIKVFEDEGEVKAIHDNLEGTQFWKNHGVNELEVTNIRSCENCRNCDYCNDATRTQSEELALQTKLLDEGTYFDQQEKKWHTTYLYIEQYLKEMMDNRPYAFKQATRFNKKMAKYPKADQEKFNQVIETGRGMGSFKRASELPHLDGLKRRYIPLNLAYSGKQESQPVRPVWDCSSVCAQGDRSFNQCVLRGPIKLQIHKSMLKLRSTPFFNICDITKGYLNIIKDDKSQSLARMFVPMVGDEVAFGNPNAELIEFVCCSCVYGEKSAGASLEMCLHKAGSQFKIDEKVRQMLEDIKYCDDMGVIADTEEDLKFAMDETEKLIEQSGMKHHPWLFTLDGKGLSAKPSEDEIGAIQVNKVLGCFICKDDFIYYDPQINLSSKLRGKHKGEALKDPNKVNQYLLLYGLTRRLYMRIVAACWCVTGGLAAIQNNLRLCFRRMLIREPPEVGWDGQLTQQSKAEFCDLCRFLLKMRGYRWRRHLQTDDPKNMIVNHELPALVAVFDGAMESAGATCYAVTRHKNDTENTVRVVMAKTKVASLAGSNLPRMELVACYLVCLIKHWIETNCPIQFSKCFILGDSTAVLSQVKNKSIIFKSFEQARIRAIQNLTESDQFYHVKSSDNASDVLTRLNLNLTKADLEEKWQNGIFLKKPISEWPIRRVADVVGDTKLPGLNPKYEQIQLNAIKVGNAAWPEIDCAAKFETYEDDQYHVSKEDVENIINIELNQAFIEEEEEETDIIFNSMLNKQKSSQNQFYADLKQKKHDPRAQPPMFLKSKKQLENELEEETELFADLLMKHRNLQWSIRVIAYMLQWRYRNKSMLELIDHATRLPEVQSATKTKHYLLGLKGIHDIIFEDDLGVPRIECRGFVGCDEIPSDNVIVANTSEYGKALLREFHDKYHNKAIRGIKARIRLAGYYIPRSTSFLKSQSINCPACIRYRKLRFQVKQGMVPLRRHKADDVYKWLTIDMFGPIHHVASLHREDRRTTHVYCLLAVCQLSGLLAIEILADASTSSVCIALDTMKTYTGQIFGLRMDAGSNLVPFSKFGEKDEGYNEAEENEIIKEKLDDIKEYCLAHKMKVDISPPKSSNYQGQAERNIGLIKELLTFEPQQRLHVLEIQALLKKAVYILNSRPVVYDDNEGAVLSRLDLLSLRLKSGQNPLLFAEPTPIIDAGDFQSHIDETEELLDQFWEKYRQLTLEQMLKIQKARFGGEIEPSLYDIVAIPDKLGRAHGMSIGRIVEILPSHDNERRVCKVEIARKSRRTHPWPLHKSTAKKKKFTRAVDKLVFLLRKIPQSKDDGRPYKAFLYEDILGLPFMDGTEDDDDDEKDDNHELHVESDQDEEEPIQGIDENNGEIYDIAEESGLDEDDNENLSEDNIEEENDYDGGNDDIQEVKFTFVGDSDIEEEIHDMPAKIKRKGRPNKRQ